MKETTYGSPIQKQKNLNDMIPPEAKAEIQKQIKEKEDELKSKSKSDEDYESLANEIKMMKEQIGSLSGETSAEQPKIEFIKMYFMGDNVRTETVIDGKPSGSAIIKVKEKKMVIIMDEEKKYMEMDFEMLKQMAAAFKKMKPTDQKKDEEPQPKSNVKKTGNHMDILGYKCDEYIMESEETNSTAWICPNFTNFWKIFAEMGKSFEMDKQDRKSVV
jgi:hypothetical protein